MSDMHEDSLNRLKDIKVPASSVAGRRRAMGAALLAFDREAVEKETAQAAQGSARLQRLKSILPSLKGHWIMDSRRYIPVGAGALALLVLLPLGYQLYSTTALTSLPPASLLAPKDTAVSTPPVATAAAKTAVSSATAAAPVPAPMTTAERSTTLDSPKLEPAPVLAKPAAPALPLARDELALNAAAPASAAAARTDAGAQDAADLASVNAPSGPPVTMARSVAPRSAGGLATSASGDKFQNFNESAQKAVATDPVSTFSIDVDTASYSYVRRALNEGRIPEPDAVRIEEMINYFPYDYPAPSSADQPFKPTISVFPTPWNAHTELMRIGIKGYAPPAAAQKPANLVFLIDTSGSMDEPDKLPLLQRALGLLVNSLPADDTVSIVAYAGSAGVVLEPTMASDKSKILSALDNLSAGGSTAGAEGIELAYQLAAQHKLDGGNNRVILATDGDFNVGISDPGALKDFIKQKRQSGISLSVLGFGEGNLDDETMQALAQNGDGNASYIDSLSEAQKVLVKEAGSTLDTIAKDVKIQVEFNPATVSSYRLIGYETRALNREDFNNDKVDAGDVGAGHAVTALYEITPAGTDATPPVDPLRYGAPPAQAVPPAAAADAKAAELADVKLRYKLPGSDISKLIEQPVTSGMAVSDIAKAPDDARWTAAVAAFGQKLRGSDYAGSMTYNAIAQLAAGARGSDAEGYRAEFIRLVGLAAGLSGSEPAPATDRATPTPSKLN